MPVGNGLMGEQDLEDDGRSSSLSEIEDGLVEEHAQDPTERQTDNESEAETVRLKPSPEKLRERRDVILGSDIGRNVDEVLLSTREHSANRNSQPGLNETARVPNSDKGLSYNPGIGDASADQETVPPETPLLNPIASPHSVPSPPEIAGRKRKRHDVNGDAGDASGSGSEDREAGEPLAKRTGAIRSELNGEGGQERLQVEEKITQTEIYESITPKNVQPQAEVVGIVEQAVVVQKESPSRRGRRKATQNQPSELKAVEVAVSVSEEVDREMLDVGEAHTPQVDAEAVAEAEDEEEDVDTPAKNEEGSKRPDRAA